MNIKLLACKVLSREVGYLAAGCGNFIDATFLRQGYHDQPEVLKQILQAEIDRIESGSDPYTCDPDHHAPDAIVLGYGLCSGGIDGLKTSKYKLVVPRAHDCITLFLGTKERYKSYFDSHPGTYWYTQGWIDNTRMPCETYKDHYKKIYERDYDEDSAEFLLDNMLSWLKNYDNAAYVQLKDIGSDTLCLDFTKNAAKHFGWGFDLLEGDLSLLKAALDGDWDDDRFLVLNPGESISQSYDESVVKKADDTDS